MILNERLPKVPNKAIPRVNNQCNVHVVVRCKVTELANDAILDVELLSAIMIWTNHELQVIQQDVLDIASVYGKNHRI